MNLEALAAWAAADVTLALTIGTNIFVTEMPAGKSGALLIGPYHGTPINHELPGWVQSEFRLVVRDTVYDTAKALARAMQRKLTLQLETNIGGLMFIKQMLPMNEPRPYRRSVGGYWEFEVDVAITYVDTAP